MTLRILLAVLYLASVLRSAACFVPHSTPIFDADLRFRACVGRSRARVGRFRARSISSVADERASQSAEDRVVETIRKGVAEVSAAKGIRKVPSAAGGLIDFARASGGLLEVWLTPQAIGECEQFWGYGSTTLVRDISRGRLRTFADAQAVVWFILIAVNSFPWTPLLLPLIDRALEDKAPKLPRAFAPTRRAAFRRLRQDYIDDGEGQDSSTLFYTPQNMAESLAFFRDGTRLILRDVLRGRLFRTAPDDRPVAYARFTALAFTTFPLTPMLFPVIDKWRSDRFGQRRGDYVPLIFRARKLAALRRLENGHGGGGLEGAVQTLHAAAAVATRRPSTPRLLEAILTAQRKGPGFANRLLFENLAGGGSPGRRWKLVYTAGKDAVVEARGIGKRRGGSENSEKTLVAAVAKAKAALPWSRGVFVDSYLSAIQRFDAAAFENENGVFKVLGSEEVRFTVKGPFKWPDPDKGAVCAFRPTAATVKFFGWEQEWPLNQGPKSFDETPPTKLPFFKFIYVDDKVAVAQGRSGGVALWARIQ